MDVLAQRGIIVQIFSSKKYQLERGESIQGWEIKYDSWCTKSGRLSIEIAEKTAVDRPWVDSGIYSGNHWMYVHGNEHTFWLFFTHFLQQLHRAQKYEVKEEATIRTFYLPVADADKYGYRIDVSTNGNSEQLAF